MAEISVEETAPGEYRVRVVEGGSETTHQVTATDETVAALGGGVDPAELVDASFRFLLEREPKEAILPTFDLPVIARYFPEYAEEIRRRLETPPAVSP
ncbi:MAG TPA: hypothetical protein VM618_08760 [Acidimicrobiia bacterium]|nr:hypothetical protein [Acidimicrobiia bacterium]